MSKQKSTSFNEPSHDNSNHYKKVQNDQTKTLQSETITQNRTGSQLLVEALLHEGVDFIFGYPGGAVLTLIRYIL